MIVLIAILVALVAAELWAVYCLFKLLLDFLKTLIFLGEEVKQKMNAIIEQLTAINTAVTAAALQVIKAKDEVVAKITALEDALANGAITPEVQAALNALKGTVTDLEAAAQAIDNVVPDAPPPAPAG